MIDQGRILQESHHWASLMHYVFKAWEIAKDLPEWKYEDSYNITHKCCKDLSQFCIEALKRGDFEASVLDDYIERYVKKDCFHFLSPNATLRSN